MKKYTVNPVKMECGGVLLSATVWPLKKSNTDDADFYGFTQIKNYNVLN